MGNMPTGKTFWQSLKEQSEEIKRNIERDKELLIVDGKVYTGEKEE